MVKINKKSNFINIVIILIVAIFFIGDRLLKWLAINNVFKPSVVLIKKTFFLDFIPNYKIAFSLPLQGWLLNVLIILIILVLLIIIIHLLKSRREQTITIILLATIWLGAVSNLTDRLSLGYVVDYLYIQHFTVFNLADVMISFSAIALIIENLNKKI